MPSGDLITRTYANFLGVDFSDYKISLFRSPDALNVWKNYKKLGKCIETRPDLELFKQMNNTIFGLFFYTYSEILHLIIHSGDGLYEYNFSTQQTKTIKATGMNQKKSQFFVFDDVLYVKDGLNYLMYNGISCSEVEGFVPTTSISRQPSGGGSIFQEVNLLTSYRKNSFCADGTSREYYLDANYIEANTVTAWINNVQVPKNNFTVNTSKGTVTFNAAPPAPDTDGEDNVVIQFSKRIPGYRERINKCTLLEVFDNRVFFSGNPDFPNTVWYSSLENPAYCSDLDYSTEGLDASPIKTMISGNNALWVFKEPSQANTSVFYHTPSIDSEQGKVYPSIHSSISTGCISTGINFNDDIVIFSESGLEGISGDVTTEQVLGHRSSLIDSKLLQESNYKNPILVEWQGYLLVFFDNHCYLADSRQRFQNVTSLEYEWYYWEFENNITAANVHDGVLYICTNNSIYTLTKENSNINSYWTTCVDDLEQPNFQKITNKRGSIAEVQGELDIYVKTDNNDWEFIDTYNTQNKKYIVPRIKKKKMERYTIQIHFTRTV